MIRKKVYYLYKEYSHFSLYYYDKTYSYCLRHFF